MHFFGKLCFKPSSDSWGIKGLDWSPISKGSCLHLLQCTLSPSVIGSRAWFLFSLGLFSIFFSSSLLYLLAKFVWKSKAPLKVLAFAWLVVHKKVNTNDMLQLRRPYKSLSPYWCILCMRSGELIDHLFLHCPLTLRIWHKFFSLAKINWVSPRSIGDMMTISFGGLGSSVKGKTPWQIAYLTILWIVWQDINARIF